MSRSIIADEIDREYKLKQVYKKKKVRQKCIIDNQKRCKECKYFSICTEGGLK